MLKHFSKVTSDELGDEYEPLIDPDNARLLAELEDDEIAVLEHLAATGQFGKIMEHPLFKYRDEYENSKGRGPEADDNAEFNDPDQDEHTEEARRMQAKKDDSPLGHSDGTRAPRDYDLPPSQNSAEAQERGAEAQDAEAQERGEMGEIWFDWANKGRNALNSNLFNFFAK